MNYFSTNLVYLFYSTSNGYFLFADIFIPTVSNFRSRVNSYIQSTHPSSLPVANLTGRIWNLYNPSVTQLKGANFYSLAEGNLYPCRGYLISVISLRTLAEDTLISVRSLHARSTRLLMLIKNIYKNILVRIRMLIKNIYTLMKNIYTLYVHTFRQI